MKRLLPFLIILITLCCSCKDNLQDIRDRIGYGSNPARRLLHLVPVDSSFKLVEDIEGRRYIFIHEIENRLIAPAYLRKIILLDSTGKMVALEEDHFKNPRTGKYLIVTRDYSNYVTQIILQDIGDNTYHNGSQSISPSQADSILKNWRISINPF